MGPTRLAILLAGAVALAACGNCNSPTGSLADTGSGVADAAADSSSDEGDSSSADGSRARSDVGPDGSFRDATRDSGFDLPDVGGESGLPWIELSPFRRAPTAALDHAMAYDSGRQRTVLHGGEDAEAQTWEWDGKRWHRMAGVGPRLREHGMVYDAARSQLLVFGGRQGAEDRSETWVYDGASWTDVSPAVSPPARGVTELAYDADRERVVLFGGGGLGDTWEWDGAEWTELSPVSTPPARFNHVIAYDPARKRTVVFGGEASGAYLSDTWEWDGVNWSEVATTGPRARVRADLVWDPNRGQLLLTGGARGISIFSDTWAFDGTAWTELTDAALPGDRYAHDVALNLDGRLVMFGGGGDGAEPTYPRHVLKTHALGSTGTWVDVSPDVSNPTGGIGSRAAFDEARGVVVKFGGVSSSGYADETWTWDGTSWLMAADIGPSGRERHAMVWDSAGQRVLLFGGSRGNTAFDDMWSWDGAAWSEVPGGTAPAELGPRTLHQMVYDTQRARVVLFGGHAGGGAPEKRELWEWNGSSWQLRTSDAGPEYAVGHGMAYDPLNGRTIVVTRETWAWNGTEWEWLSEGGSSPTASMDAMFFDAYRSRVVLFNGSTLELEGSSWVDLTPSQSPRQTNNPAVAYDAARYRGVLFNGETWEWNGAVAAER